MGVGVYREVWVRLSVSYRQTIFPPARFRFTDQTRRSQGTRGAQRTVLVGLSMERTVPPSPTEQVEHTGAPTKYLFTGHTERHEGTSNL